jgi:hypothetical protein
MQTLIKWQSWNELENSSRQQEDNIFSQEESMMKYDDGGVDTPFGRFVMESPMRPAARWNCWLGHTNFKITDKHVEIINNTQGVAALKILDPYTFIIGVPKEFFKETNVKKRIQTKICKRNGPKTNS